MWARTKKLLKEYQLLIGAALIIIGGVYQFANALLWGWWDVGIINPETDPTFHQYFAMYFGFLVTPLFYVAFFSIIIGVVLIWRQDVPPGPSVGLKEPLTKNRKTIIGILLAAFGFTYQVIGAWILWDQEYPWAWQTEIAKYGNLLVWPLFVLSLSSLIIGAWLLYAESKRYHEIHPELYTGK